MAAKVVLVTGCSSGIGLETAVHLARDPEKRFKVYATMRNLAKKENLEKAAGDLLNKTLFIRRLDVNNKGSRKDFLKTLKEEAGDVDILVNNAGMGHGGIAETVSEDEIRKVFEVNVFSLIMLTQAVIPGMKAKKWGRIINMSSMAGLQGFVFNDMYCASKHAVEGFSESLAPYLAQFNVGVVLIEPGPVTSNFVDNMAGNMGGLSTDNMSKSDEQTAKLYKTSIENGQKLYTMAQTSPEIAEEVKKAIVAEKPQLRYQTAEAWRQQASFKYTDPTGNSLVKAATEFNGWPQPQ